MSAYFGKDDSYGYPPEIANIIYHIHLCIPPDKFDINIPQMHRTCKKNNGVERDVALLYTQGMDDLDSYCLLAVFMPSAHQKAHNEKLMLRIGRHAREFKYNN